MGIIEVKQVNGIPIFWDRLCYYFYYWDNGKKRTSKDINRLVKQLSK